MRILIYIYRTLLFVALAAAAVFGVKTLLSYNDNLLYWVALLVVAVGICFVISDMFKADKDKKHTFDVQNFENNEQNRTVILNNLSSEFDQGKISENRVFYINGDGCNSDNFVYCDTLKNTVGIANTDYCVSIPKQDIERRVEGFKKEITLVLDGKVLLVRAFDSKGRMIKFTACHETCLNSCINKIKSPYKQISVFKRILFYVLFILPPKDYEIDVTDLYGRKVNLQ